MVARCTGTGLPLPGRLRAADVERLALVAYQLRARVRAAPYAPHDHHWWLCSQLRSAGELTGLVFILAALVPDRPLSELAWWRERPGVDT